MEHLSREQIGAAAFSGFGPSIFWPFRRRSQTLDVARDLADVRRMMRDACPRRPGVYGMIDSRGHLIYVGMSAMLPKRLVTYFQGGAAIRKEYRIAAHTDRLVWEVVGHELGAQLRELELIRRHQPRFNVKGRQPNRMPGYIYISREEAPRVRVGRRIPHGVRYSWGPLAIGWRIKEAVEVVNRLFKLRDCLASVRMNFAEQQSLFSLELRLECVRGETGSCLGPCGGQCSRTQYNAQLRAARAFLDGRDLAPLVRLEDELQVAAANLHYERAAGIRDKLDRLRLLSDRLAIMREPPLPAQFIYPVQLGSRAIWYLVDGSRVVAGIPLPTNDAEASKCLRRLRRTYESAAVERPDIDRLAAQILRGWFRTRAAELQGALSPSEAMQFCRQLCAG